MQILEEKIDAVLLLKLSGRIDASTAKDIKEKIRSLIQARQVNLVIDMAEVDFIDSSGLGSLVASLRSIVQAGGNIKIARLQDRVRTVFELTRLHKVFDIFNDKVSAIKSYS